MNRVMVMLPLIFGSVACGAGSDTPELSEVTLSQTDVRYADEFFASFGAKDQNGDLDRAFVAIHMYGPEEDDDDIDEDEVELDATVHATEIAAGATEANMAVAMTLTGQFPLGVYQLELRVTDNAGHESDPAKARINLIRGGGNPGISRPN
jgi:hypothetical protein